MRRAHEPARGTASDVGMEARVQRSATTPYSHNNCSNPYNVWASNWPLSAVLWIRSAMISLRSYVRRHSRRTAVFCVYITLLLQVAITASTMSITRDEVGHLGAGVYLWDSGHCDVYRTNPPLVRAVACAPVVLLKPTRDYREYKDGPNIRVEWALGQALITANKDSWEWYVLLARWTVLPFCVIGAWCVHRWASQLYNTRRNGCRHTEAESRMLGGRSITCGFISLTLYCICPNIVAWSSTFTPDAGAAALGVVAGYTFWKWLREPCKWNAVASGISLGLAELTKFSWIILFPLWVVLWMFWRLTGNESTQSASPIDSPVHTVDSTSAVHSDETDSPRTGNSGASYKELSLICLIGLYIVNAGYGFDGSLTPLKEYVFVSRSLAGADSKLDHGLGGNRFSDSWIGQLPVPLPFDYLRGIDLQRAEFEEGKPSYMDGRWSKRGWWYYYLYAATLKIPVGIWVLGFVVVVTKVTGVKCASADTDSTWRDEVVLLTPAIALWCVVSSQTGFSRYFRYVLPCLPFVYIWLGQAGYCAHACRLGTAGFDAHKARIGRTLRRICSPALVALGLGWASISSLAMCPYSMSYFNEIAGGPRSGHKYLLDANIDWGQDIYHLRRWLRSHPEARPIYLASNSFVQPWQFGIAHRTPPKTPTPGWFAMSIHRLNSKDEAYRFLLRCEPIAMAGYSIYIYHITSDMANRLRKELGYPPLKRID